MNQITVIPITFLCTIFYISCSGQSNKSLQETWGSAPSETTSRIKIITPNLEKADVRSILTDRLAVAGFKLRSSEDTKISTLPKRVDFFYIQLEVSFFDNFAIISGDQGDESLTGLPVVGDVNSSEMDWHTIFYGSRGWQEMNKIKDYFPRYKVEYNKITSSR